MSALESARSHALKTLQIDALLLLAQIHLRNAHTDQAADSCRDALRLQAGQTTHKTAIAQKLLQQALQPSPTRMSN